MGSTIVLLFIFVGLSVAHPAFQHHFHKIVNSDKCVKNCMKIIQDSEQEISILKNANISGFLLDLDTICGTIRNASECMSECTHDQNNPFALSSTIKICDDEARKDVELLQKCLTEKGDLVAKTCVDECGDYNEVNDKVHNMTMEMSHPHHAEQAEKVMEKANEACKILKCNSRCSVQSFDDECEAISDDLGAGDLIQSLIERVLKAQRKDLEKFDLVDTFAHSAPNECNYQYMPEVMFNETKDELSQLVIEDMKSLNKNDVKSSTQVPDQIHLIRHHAHHDISYSLSQLQNRLIQKQFFVLEEQEKNLQKEAKKLDLELALLEHKKEALDKTD